jgi:hypothetical protein
MLFFEYSLKAAGEKIHASFIKFMVNKKVLTGTFPPLELHQLQSPFGPSSSLSSAKFPFQLSVLLFRGRIHHC